MSADMEECIGNCNSNEELRKAIERHEELKPALQNSLSVPVDPCNSVFSKLSLKDKRFQTFSPCTDEELTNYHLPNDRFNENISELERKNVSKIVQSSTSFYVLIPLGVLIASTSLNAQLMIALFIFLLGERKKLKALVIQHHIMMTKAASTITREKTQKKNSSPLSWKILSFFDFQTQFQKSALKLKNAQQIIQIALCMCECVF